MLDKIQENGGSLRPPVNSADVLLEIGRINGIRTSNIESLRDDFDQKFQEWQSTGANPPRLITSVGGSTETPSVVSPGNIIVGLEALQVLNDRDVPATYSIRFASEYAIDANSFDPKKTRAAMWQTAFVYDSFVKRFYPDVADKIAIEVEAIEAVDELPDGLLDLVGYNDDNFRGSGQLKEKVEKLVRYGRKRNPDITWQKSVRYLLSHTTIFEDVLYPGAESDFVIKVGAPSEMQFSDFQQEVMDEAIAVGGIVGLLANATGTNPYRQISLFGPRLGSRPPYYKQAPEELDFLGEPISVSEVNDTLPTNLTDEQRLNALLPRAYLMAAGENRELAQRYKAFLGLLNGAKIRISEYQAWFEDTRLKLKGLQNED